MAKTHSRDYLKRLGAVILLIKSWCLLQNVIYPPPELEAFNVDHKLGRTSGSKDTSAKQQNKSQLFVLDGSDKSLDILSILMGARTTRENTFTNLH